METVADRLEALKKHFDWKNTDLARESEVTRQAVGKWFNDGAVPDWDTLAPLRRNHKVNIEWILTGHGEMIISPEDAYVAEVRESAQQLDEDQRQSVLSIVRNFLRKNVVSR